jgi:hypothetical protein
MNEQGRPPATAFPGASPAPARPSMPAHNVAAGSPQLAAGRPAAGSGTPAQRPPQAPQRPHAAPLPQAPMPTRLPKPAPRRPAAPRPQIAPPLRPLQPPQAAGRSHNPPTPPRPYPPTPAGLRPRGPQAAPPPHPQAAVPPVPPAQPEPLGPPPRPRKRKIGRWIALLVVAGGVGGAVWYGTHAAPATTGVGDCLAQTGGNELTKVGCGDKSARFLVVGKLENKTVVDATLDACQPFPKATSAYWQGESGQPGLVLCLEPVAAAAPTK